MKIELQKGIYSDIGLIIEYLGIIDQSNLLATSKINRYKYKKLFNIQKPNNSGISSEGATITTIVYGPECEVRKYHWTSYTTTHTIGCTADIPIA